MDKEMQIIIEPSSNELQPLQTWDEDPTLLDANGVEVEGTTKELRVRLDKWLWAARFFKTLALARAAIDNDKVLYNGQTTKPSREIQVGAHLVIQQGRTERHVIIEGLSTRRRSAKEASELYSELAAQTNRWSDQSTDMHDSNCIAHPYRRPFTTTDNAKRVRYHLRRSYGRTGSTYRRKDGA